MRRIVILVTVVALMVVMLAMTITPAFAIGGSPQNSCLASIFSWSASNGNSNAPFCPGVDHPGGRP